jgi:hypothetical protein
MSWNKKLARSGGSRVLDFIGDWYEQSFLILKWPLEDRFAPSGYPRAKIDREDS